MDIEVVIWGYTPIVIALGEVIISLIITIRKVSYYDIIATIIILVLNYLSIYILISMLMGSWPTYLPHLLISAATLLTVVQIINRKREHKML